jgi:hypothetical protein
VLPGLADISVHFIYNWIQPFGLEGLFDVKGTLHVLQVCPNTLSLRRRADWRVWQWASRMKKYLADRKGAAPFTDITGAEAAGLVVLAPFEPYDVVGFNSVEAK